MKKYLVAILAAAATLTFSSCSTNEELSEIENHTSNVRALTLTAEIPGIESNTRTEFGNTDGQIVPLWSEGYFSNELKTMPDALYAFFNGQKRVYRFNKADATPEATTSFVEQIPEDGSSLKADLANVDDTTKVYFVKSNNYENTIKRGEGSCATPSVEIFGHNTKLGNINGGDDVLVSKPVTAGTIKNEGTDNINLSLKRNVAFIRINIISDEGFVIENVSPIGSIYISTSPDDIDDPNKLNFGGQSVINLETGDLIREQTKYCNSQTVYWPYFTESDVNNPIIKTGENGYPAFITVFPMSLKEGDKFYVTLENICKSFYKKECVVGQGGIDFEAGKITTLNIYIEKEHFLQDYLVQSEAGNVTEETLQSVVEECKKNQEYSLVLYGNYNAKDIGLIGTFLKGYGDQMHRMNTVDLQFAKIISDESSYKGPDGQDIRIEEDNTIPEYFMWDFFGLKTIQTSTETKYIKANAFVKNVMLKDIYIHSKEVTIEENAFAIGDAVRQNGKVAVYTAPGPNTHIADKFIKCNNKEVDLVINKKWSDPALGKDMVDTTTKMWKGIKWASVVLTEN